MGRWAVRDGDDELFVVESRPDGSLSLHIPSREPLVVTRAQAERIRMYIGAAIDNVCPGPSS